MSRVTKGLGDGAHCDEHEDEGNGIGTPGGHRVMVCLRIIDCGIIEVEGPVPAIKAIHTRGMDHDSSALLYNARQVLSMREVVCCIVVTLQNQLLAQ